MANKRRDVYKAKPMTEGKKAVSPSALMKALYLEHLRLPRSGQCHLETGEESMVSSRSCIKEGFQNKQKAVLLTSSRTATY